MQRSLLDGKMGWCNSADRKEKSMHCVTASAKSYFIMNANELTHRSSSPSPHHRHHWRAWSIYDRFMRKFFLNCVQKGQSRDCIRRLIIINCQTLAPEFNFLSVPCVGYTPRIFNQSLLTAYLRIDDKVWYSTLNDKHSDCLLKVSGNHGLNDIHNTVYIRYLLAPCNYIYS